LLLASCDRPVSPPAGGSLTFQVVSGDQQTGAAGIQLPAALVVKVTKPDGGPLKDQILNFRVIAGGGSVFGGTEITNNDGVARELWTLGPKAGEPQRIEVRAVNPATGEPQVFAVFTATAVAGPPARMSKLAGDHQEVEPGETAPIPPSVKLEDQFGNPTANIGVEFTVTRGSVTGGHATTDANGVATVGSWTVGSVITTDTLVASASASGVSGNPARFVAVVRFCDCWSTKASLLEQVTSAAAGTINGKLYVFGGQRPNGATSSSLEEYDPATNAWTLTAAGFLPRQTAGVAVLDNQLYVTGGWGGSYNVEYLDSYDPATGQWNRHTSDPTGRQLLGAAAIDGILYAVGGLEFNTYNPLQTLNAYNPATDSWTSLAPMPTARYYVATAVLDGKLYVMGGYNNRGWGVLSAVEVYDPATNSWTTETPLPLVRYGASAAAINGKIYVAGGSDSNGDASATLFEFDPTTHAWTTKQPMPTSRYLTAGAVLNGSFYVAGGYSNGIYRNTVEAYRP